MKIRVRILLAALVTAVGLLAAGGAHAQPRMEPTPEGVTVPTPERDVWLRRLVGTFKLDGMIQLGDCDSDEPRCAGIKGKMDCTAVGAGPGVQCVMNASWLDELNPYLDPAMNLFGLDPGGAAINMMLVNDRGLPTHGFATVKGHFGLFRTLCPGANDDGCQVGIRIEAKPDANLNYMWIGENVVMSMRRVTPAEFKLLPAPKMR